MVHHKETKRSLGALSRRFAIVSVLFLVHLGFENPLHAQPVEPGRILSSTGVAWGGLIAFNVDGSNSYNLTANTFDGSYRDLRHKSHHPSVSLNGIIAFASNRTGKSRVFAINGDGTGLRQLTNDEGLSDPSAVNDINPVISPDGTMVAFVSNRTSDVGNRNIFIVPTDGSVPPIQVTETQSYMGAYSTIDTVAWGPDNATLVFIGRRLASCDGDPCFRSVVGFVRKDGTGERYLADYHPNCLYCSAIDYSPDGTKVAHFEGGPYCGGSYWLVTTELSDHSRTVIPQDVLGNPAVWAGGLRFSPDSTRLLYQDGTTPTVINLDGTGKSPIPGVSLAAGEPLWWAPGLAIPAPDRLEIEPPVGMVWPGHPLQLLPTLYGADGSVIVRAAQRWEGNYFQDLFESTGIFYAHPTEYHTFDLTAYNAGKSASVRVYSSPRPDDALKIFGPSRAEVGSAADYVVRFKNLEESPVEDAVVLLDVPAVADYVSSSPEGYYWPERGEVFWKLGEVASGEERFLSAKLRFKWGTPGHTPFTTYSALGGSNLPSSPFDLVDYLAYEPKRLTEARQLSQGEIRQILDANAQAKSLLEWALEQGYTFYDVGCKLLYEDGTEMFFLVLNPPSEKAFVLMTLSAGTVFMEKFTEASYSIFDARGGISYDPRLSAFQAFGDWAVAHSPSRANCFINCVLHKIPEMVIAQKFDWYANLSTTAKFTELIFKCTMNRDPFACLDSNTMLLNQILSEGIQKTAGKFPVIDVGWALGECKHDCDLDPSQHVCDGDLVICDKPNWFERNIMQWTAVRRKRGCRNGIYDWGPPEAVGCSTIQPCGFGQISACVDGACGCVDCQTPQTDCRGGEVTTAKDPNEKTGQSGDVAPGQLLEYQISCENVGEGTAYDVYLLDELDPGLDISTVEAGSGGVVIPSIPGVFWYIGDLVPGEGRTVSLRAMVRQDAEEGATLVNTAKVFFPSVPEVTPTNAIVNRVVSVAAFPQELATSEDQPVDILLEGNGPAGCPLSYRVTRGPFNGSLEGDPPQVQYTPAPGFEGPDSFSFVVSCQDLTSPEATVSITVMPSDHDAEPPLVERVSPASGEFVPVRSRPLSQDPLLYAPIVEGCFNERLEAATVTSDTFLLKEGDSLVPALVSYNDLTRCASLFPQTPLGYDKTYTAFLTTGISDSSGNPLSAPFTWSFSTLGEVPVVLSAQSLDFGNVTVGQASEWRAVTLQNKGEDPVEIGEIRITGASAAEFASDGACANSLLLGGNACAVNLRMTPQSAGQKEAVLEVAVSGLGTLTTQLRGSGVGGGAPALVVRPAQGTDGTDVVISGSGFGVSRGTVWMRPSGGAGGITRCKALEWGDSEIRCRVRRPPTVGPYDLGVEPRRAPVLVERAAFFVMGPEITGVLPSTNVKRGQVVLLTGRFFGATKGRIYLEQTTESGAVRRTPCPVRYWAMDPLTSQGRVAVTVPSRVAPGSYTLRLINMLGSATQPLTVE
jgi:hypothetical protein